jgi:hypothetical protein
MSGFIHGHVPFLGLSESIYSGISPAVQRQEVMDPVGESVNRFCYLKRRADLGDEVG